MIGANPFFKKPVYRSMVYTERDGQRDAELRAVREKYENGAVRKIDGHSRFGFGVKLPHVIAPLPTAPAVVGGNVDWSKIKASPKTEYLHSVLSTGRPMNPAPALGSVLRLGEPNINSIHTTY